MHRLVFLPVLALAAVLTTVATAQADVIVSPPSDSSSQVVVRTKPPTVVVVRQKAAAPARVVKEAPPKDRERKVGLHFDVAGTFGPSVRMGGFDGALRFRPAPHFGIDLGSGYFAGNDYDGDFRREVPVTTNFLFFVNPKSKVQFYVLLGAGLSFGKKESFNEVRNMTHAGGQAGVGLEFRLAPGFALNTDVRGVLRHRIDNDPRPEFLDGPRSSDTSGGALLTFGGTFYF
ncbi:MAG: porin family protein [Myxococcales bacterium]|nr:porin family protein [Myxococcales bacterium]MDH3483359.1 porin family protein [Myxococcales bacterium]